MGTTFLKHEGYCTDKVTPGYISKPREKCHLQPLPMDIDKVINYNIRFKWKK